MSQAFARTYDPLNPAVTADPYPYYAALREYEPVRWVPSIQGYVVSRWDDVLTVLKDARTFSSSSFWPALLGPYDPVPEVAPMISLDPPRHTTIRKLANKAFIPKRVDAMEQSIRATVDALIDDILQKHGAAGEFDFVAEFSGLFPVSVIADMLGVDRNKRTEFKVWADHILSASNRDAYGPQRLAEIEKSKTEIRAYFEEIYDQRLARPGDDMISGFIEAEVDGQKLSRVEVLNLGILLLIGGIETTTNLIGNTIAYLPRYPDIADRVGADPLLRRQLIEEMLRFEAPTQILFRHTTVDTVLRGVAIPEGSLIIPLLGSANRDERKFEDPDTIIPGRATKESLTFGQGAHACIGSYLTRLEARIALDQLFSRFDALTAIKPEVDWLDSFFSRGPRNLPVRFRAA